MNEYKIITAKEAHELTENSCKERIEKELRLIEQAIKNASINGLDMVVYLTTKNPTKQDKKNIIKILKKQGYLVSYDDNDNDEFMNLKSFEYSSFVIEW